MKKLYVASLVSCCVLMTSSGTVLAQDGNALVIPVELFTCNYNKGKGPADLDKAVVKWNSWADTIEMDDYSAWTLTPFYYGADQKFDVIWLGAAKDAVALGKAQDAYLNEDAGVRQAFAEAISCDVHANFASLNYKAPPSSASTANSVITFSDCSYKEGSSFAALNLSMAKWSKHLSDAGSNTSIFHWYPMYGGGGGGEEFSFKWIETHENFAALGADYEVMGNGKGYEVSNELLNDIVDCDSSRAYVAQSRRFVQLR